MQQGQARDTDAMWLKFAKIIISDYIPSWEKEKVLSYYVRPRDVDLAPDESAFQLLPKPKPMIEKSLEETIQRNITDDPQPVIRAYEDGFLSPKGEFYAIFPGDHEHFNYYATYGTELNSLKPLGWAEVHNNWWDCDYPLTPQQKEAMQLWIEDCKDYGFIEDALGFLAENARCG